MLCVGCFVVGANCLLFAVWGSMGVARDVLFVVRGLLFACFVYCSLFAVPCLRFVVCRLLFVDLCVMNVVCC